MSRGQKQAWFNLAIIVLTVGGIVALTPVLGFQRAHGSLGLLGFLGLTPFLFRKRPGIVVSDERDGVIQVRSWVIAYSLFWVVFVFTCLAALLHYGSIGAVPVFLVGLGPWYGFILVIVVSSIASLVQYGWGGSDGAQ